MQIVTSILYLFLLFCMSCTHQEYYSIDSNPRGVKVFQVENKGQYLGLTPLFFKGRQYHRELFSFELNYFSQDKIWSKKDLLVEKQEQCHLRFTDPLLAKIPVMNKIIPEALPEVIQSYNPLSIIKGTLMECGPSVWGEFKEIPPQEEKEVCKKYIVIPPVHPYQKVSDIMMSEWVNQIFIKKELACDQVVSFRESQLRLQFYGLNHLSYRQGFSYMTNKELAEIGYAFQATHIVILKYLQEGDSYKVTPEVYDIHSRDYIAGPLNTSYKMNVAIKDTLKIKEMINRSFQWIPNTIQLKFSINKQLEFREQARPWDLPTQTGRFDWIPGIRIGTIEYPLGRFGAHLRFGPSASLNRWNEEYLVFFANLVMAAKLFIHLPLGALRLDAGVGLSYMRYGMDEHERNRFLPIRQLSAGYYYFITERIFWMINVRRNYLPSRTVYLEGKELVSYTDTAFRIGLFYPESKLWFGKIF